MKTLFKRLFGIALLPFLYTRYSIVFFIPAILSNKDYAIAWFLYAFFFAFLMGTCGLMKYWAKIFQKVFRIKYEVGKQWQNQGIYSFSLWSYPTLIVNGVEHKISIPVEGGNLYNEEECVMRKAVVLFFLG